MSIVLRDVPFQGRRMRGAIVVCGHCGATKTVPVNQFAHSSARDQDILAQQFVARKLTAEGWLIAKKESAHRCPGCYSAIKARQAQKNEAKENVVEFPKEPAVVKAVREMSRDDRRIIFEKLNEVYLDEKTGYGPGWTDAKVATDLGVPRAWVVKVRDEMFGPEGANEEIRATIADAQAVLSQIKQLAEPFKGLLGKADAIEKKLLQIEKDLR